MKVWAGRGGSVVQGGVAGERRRGTTMESRTMNIGCELGD